MLADKMNLGVALLAGLPDRGAHGRAPRAPMDGFTACLAARL